MAKPYKVTFTKRACHKNQVWRMDVEAFSAKDAIAKVYNFWNKESGVHMYGIQSTLMKKNETITYPAPTQMQMQEQKKDGGR